MGAGGQLVLCARQDILDFIKLPGNKMKVTMSKMFT